MVREVKEDMLSEALDMVRKTFDEDLAPGYTEEGRQTFYSFLEAIADGSAGDVKLWYYMLDDIVAGVFAIRGGSHIALCFTDKAYRRKGIGKELFETVKTILMAQLKQEMTVNADVGAADFYRSLGFCQTAAEQTENGISYIPMSYRIM